ncbi:uncharacterized protein J8A68_002721 [[Candida] subhashii]|uniref:Uncharacterized protein n=1 Tax=[Candida] subhashii TaxID=561895 RepID=A0A8J5QKE1_9ASCO|nr:uncharacterized protein J8A68_002721 [[Candida] subhashii]KAG7663748.1 hypothetical protein J8A68_002721 [[Candida] subhashii]
MNINTSYSKIQDILTNKSSQSSTATATNTSNLPTIKPSQYELERTRSSTITSMDAVTIHSVVDRDRLPIYYGYDDNDDDTHDNDDHPIDTSSTITDIQLLTPDKAHSLSSPHGQPDPTIRPTLLRKRSATTSVIEDVTTSQQLQSPTWILSNLLSNFGGALRDMDEYTIVSKSNDLVLLFQNYPNLRDEIQIKSVIPKVQFMLYHKISEVRSSGYRILRYCISNYESLNLLIQSKLLIFLIVTLGKKPGSRQGVNRCNLCELEQAVKLIREFLNIDNGADNLSIGVVKALIAIVESNENDDNGRYYQNATNGDGHDDDYDDDDDIEAMPEWFKNACLETICEIAILKPELVFHSGGFKLIMNSIIDGSVEISSTCLMLLFKIMDFQNSRKFLRNGFDLDSLISIFSNSTDDVEVVNGGGGGGDKSRRVVSNFKLQKVSFLISILLKHFNGLIAYSIGNFISIKNLIANLSKRNPKVRDYIMDIFFDVLGIQQFPWLANSAIGESIKRFNDSIKNQNYSFEYPILDPIENQFEYNIKNHYCGLIVLILIKNDIFPKLIEIIEQNLDQSNTKKATRLLTHIYSMANNFLPSELICKDLLLPNLSSHASFEVVSVTRKNFITSTDYLSNIKTSIQKINLQQRYNVDDAEFKSLITNTKILTIKEFEDWNWTLLLNLIQGPLRNPKRFDETIEKYPKFLKRIMSFYRPFKYRFSKVLLTSRGSTKYINIGCQLLEMLLEFDQGVKYLSTSKLLPQLSEIVAQIDPYSGVASKESIISKKRIENTCSVGYLRFIGVLSGKAAGIKMLEHWQFFTLLSHIVESTVQSENNNTFLLTLFKYIDFSLDSQFRLILMYCLKISNLKIRNYLLKHLLPSLIKITQCEFFVIRILVANLYDSDYEFVQRSIDLLYEYYQSNSFTNLDRLIALRPSISILSRYETTGRNLLIRMFQVPIGFKYLEESGFLDSEFDKWCKIDGFSYLSKIETLIKCQFFPFLNQGPPSTSLSVYFFKYLLSTEEGLNYFSYGKGKEFLDGIIESIEIIFTTINQQDEFLDIDNQDQTRGDLLHDLKQNLWIIGNIASSKHGIKLLDPMYSTTTIQPKKSIIDLILENFHTCPIWQLRGICFYILGMISNTIEGIEILDEFNWISVLDQYGNSKCLTFPNCEISEFFKIEITNPYRDTRYYQIFNNVGSGSGAGTSFVWNIDNLKNGDAGGDVIGDELLESDEDSSGNVRVNDRIISLMQHLNAVLSKIENKAIRELIKLKKQSPELFNDMGLFLEVIKLVDKGTFKFQKRVFIFNLFSDTKVLENLVKRERRGSFR